MASIKYGSFVTEIKGKVGGQVFQGGRSGGQVHNKPARKSTPSNAWSNVKDSFGQTSSQWNAITAGDRTNWNTLASGMTRYNKFNDPYTPSGYQIFMEYNATVAFYDPNGRIASPPSPQVLPIFNALVLTVVATPADFKLEWTYVSDAGDWYLAVFLFAVHSPGSIPTYRTPKYTDGIGQITSELVDFTGYITDRYTTSMLTGRSITIGYKLINPVTGQSSVIYPLTLPIA